MFSRITSHIHRSSSTPCTITSHLRTITCASSLPHPPTSTCRTFATATATAVTSSTPSPTPTPTPTPSPIPTQSSYLASVEKRFLGRLAVARTRVEKGLARSLPIKVVTKTSAPIHPDILLSSDAFLAKRGESRTYMIWKFLKTYAPLTRIQLWMVHGPGGINPILRSKKQLAHITTNLKRMKLVYTRPPPRTDPLSSGPSSTRASHEVRGQEWYHCYYHVRKFDGTDPMELLFKQQRKALGLRPWTPEKKRPKTASQIRFMERQHAAFEARHGYPYPAHPIRHKPIKPDYTRKTPKVVRYDEIKKAKIALQANIDAETAKSRKELETI